MKKESIKFDQYRVVKLIKIRHLKLLKGKLNTLYKH